MGKILNENGENIEQKWGKYRRDMKDIVSQNVCKLFVDEKNSDTVVVIFGTMSCVWWFWL